MNYKKLYELIIIFGIIQLIGFEFMEFLIIDPDGYLLRFSQDTREKEIDEKGDNI